MKDHNENTRRNDVETFRIWLPLLAHIGGLLVIGAVVVTKVNRLERQVDTIFAEFHAHEKLLGHGGAIYRLESLDSRILELEKKLYSRDR